MYTNMLRIGLFLMFCITCKEAYGQENIPYELHCWFYDIHHVGVSGIYVRVQGETTTQQTDRFGHVKLMFPSKTKGDNVLLELSSAERYALKNPSRGAFQLPPFASNKKEFTVWTPKERAYDKEETQRIISDDIRAKMEKMIAMSYNEKERLRVRIKKLELDSANCYNQSQKLNYLISKLQLDTARLNQNCDSLNELFVEQDNIIDRIKYENSQFKRTVDIGWGAIINERAKEVGRSIADTLSMIDSLNATPKQLKLINAYDRGDYATIYSSLNISLTIAEITSLYDRFSHAIESGREISLLNNALSLQFNPLIQFRAITGDSIRGGWTLARFRLRFSGFIGDTTIRYNIQFGLSKIDGRSEPTLNKNYINPILDFLVSWKIKPNVSISGGIGKLPGNRERLIDVRYLQFIDRSIVDSVFTMDRDLNIQLQCIKSRFKYYVAISEGNGRTWRTTGGSGSYTGRIEYAPLGTFDETMQSDPLRTSRPKLSLGLAFNHNHGAVRQGGERGAFAIDTARQMRTNFDTWFADCLFKYAGFSLNSEFIYRRNSSSSSKWNVGFRTGSGFNVQAGIFMIRTELVLRYSQILPFNELSSISERRNFTVGLNRFFYNNKVRIQADVTQQIQPGQRSLSFARLQMGFML